MSYDRSLKTNNYFKGIKNTCRYIMRHHTGSLAPAINQARYCATNTNLVSYHYVIGYDGEVRQLADDTKCTRHAGKGHRDGIKDKMNLHSIGISFCSDGSSFTLAQLESGIALAKDLMEKHDIEPQCNIRHKDYAPKRKTDLADSFRSPQYDSRESFQASLGSIGQDTQLLQRLIEDGYWNGIEGDGVTNRTALLVAKTKYT